MRYTKEDRQLMKKMCPKARMMYKFRKKLEAKAPGYEAVIALLPKEDWDERCRLIDCMAKQLKTKYDLD